MWVAFHWSASHPLSIWHKLPPVPVGEKGKTSEILRLKDKHFGNFRKKFVLGIHTVRRAITGTELHVTVIARVGG